jgi:hypothetical protein
MQPVSEPCALASRSLRCVDVKRAGEAIAVERAASPASTYCASWHPVCGVLQYVADQVEGSHIRYAFRTGSCRKSLRPEADLHTGRIEHINRIGVKCPSSTSVFVIPKDYVKNGEERLVVLNRVARSVVVKVAPAMVR